MRTRLQPVSDVEEIPALVGGEPMSVPESTRGQSALTGLLLTSLRALSQRAVIALNATADLLLVGSAFVLWLRVMDAPTVLQLVGLGGYAAFILMAIFARKR